MKKILLLVALLFLPSIINAQEMELNFKTTVSIEGKELEKDEFEFNLKDYEGNLLQTKTNDEEGNVIFDTITKDVPVNEFILYTIEQVKKENKAYILDDNITYIRVSTQEVKYYKEIPSEIELRNSKLIYHEDSKAYHAPEEELQGEAYAVYDRQTKELTFFRDQEGKYSDGLIGNDKIYYTNFESTGSSQWNCWNCDTKITDEVVKIKFKDAIKPIAIKYWFSGMKNLEEIDLAKLDTSLVTDMHDLFRDNGKLEKLDLSTFDTSKVTNMDYMFLYDTSLEEIIFYNWDINKVTTFSQMFGHTNSLKYMDLQNLNGLYSFPYHQMQGWITFSSIKYLAFPGIQEYQSTISGGGMIQDARELEYLDLSNIKNMNYYINRNWTFSASFNHTINLKTLKVGECFNPSPDSIPSGDNELASGWYSLETKEFYTISYIAHPISDCYLPQGTLIQFRDDDSLFENKFIPTMVEEETPIEIEQENPLTKDNVMVLLVLFGLSIILIIYNYRKGHELL